MGTCGKDCLKCSKDTCTTCKDKFGPVAGGTTCKACTGKDANMVTCKVGLADPATCKSGYGVKGKACVACKVTNCADCADNEAECKTCKAGYSADEKKKTCLKCADGCAACSSDCMRSCTKCVEKTKTAPSCGCAANEKWNATAGKCDGEVAPPKTEQPTNTGKTEEKKASANFLKFAAIVLVALTALISLL